MVWRRPYMFLYRSGSWTDIVLAMEWTVKLAESLAASYALKRQVVIVLQPGQVPPQQPLAMQAGRKQLVPLGDAGTD